MSDARSSSDTKPADASAAAVGASPAHEDAGQAPAGPGPATRPCPACGDGFDQQPIAGRRASRCRGCGVLYGGPAELEKLAQLLRQVQRSGLPWEEIAPPIRKQGRVRRGAACPGCGGQLVALEGHGWFACAGCSARLVPWAALDDLVADASLLRKDPAMLTPSVARAARLRVLATVLAAASGLAAAVLLPWGIASFHVELGRLGETLQGEPVPAGTPAPQPEAAVWLAIAGLGGAALAGTSAAAARRFSSRVPPGAR